MRLAEASQGNHTLRAKAAPTTRRKIMTAGADATKLGKRKSYADARRSLLALERRRATGDTASPRTAIGTTARAPASRAECY